MRSSFLVIDLGMFVALVILLALLVDAKTVVIVLTTSLLTYLHGLWTGSTGR